ncbi:uncharacterized protein N7483_002485 [Penicillium malachiteum]|uniref:uncharacterized protein n=1 Tax=Penicillium malachiteum TaxID=1324776 RepID=UPI002546A893|nr:uncharacterized protein N7483_002485 [Penicillium malachiteum]KAJ5737360.1 hypothetical protein N7483_002485 [Penicillium malachiteum]
MDSLDNGFGKQANQAAAQRSAYYKGSAVIPIQHIIFDREDIVGQREFDQKNLDRLQRIFEIEGCWNLYPEYRIAVTIDQSDLEWSLVNNNVSLEVLMDPREQPFLNFRNGTKLRCIYGKHRIKASSMCGETTWLVDLYLGCKYGNVSTHPFEEAKVIQQYRTRHFSLCK